MPLLSTELIFTKAASVGFRYAAVLQRGTAETFLSASRPLLESWQQNNFAAEMKYMLRDPQLFTSLDKILPETKAVVLVLAPYQSHSRNDGVEASGKIARYAWGKDYHQVLRQKLESLALELRQECGVSFKYRAFSDAVPILERSLAVASGMSFIGRNALAISPGLGSYFFIAELLVAVDVSGEGETRNAPTLRVLGSENSKPGVGCGACERCRPACPTAAIVADGIIDSARCISYLTIEKRGLLNRTEAESIGNWLFGCDICQEVCPFNAGATGESFPEFQSGEGAGETLTIPEVLSWRDDDLFAQRYQNSALMRAGRAQLVRNACCVAFNLRMERALPLIETAQRADTSDVVKLQAAAVMEWWER